MRHHETLLSHFKDTHFGKVPRIVCRVSVTGLPRIVDTLNSSLVVVETRSDGTHGSFVWDTGRRGRGDVWTKEVVPVTGTLVSFVPQGRPN